jgi:hypothetical protein
MKMKTMQVYFCHIGASCTWPRAAYDPADLPPEDHIEIRNRFARDARLDGLDDDAADEAGSQFYAHWLSRRWGALPIGRGDHARAYYSVRAYARKSHWHGFTGQRRQARGKRIPLGSDGKPVKATVRAIAAGEIEARERAKARANYTPAMVAEAVERIATSPALGRKARTLAQRIGSPDVRTLVREACGFSE